MIPLTTTDAASVVKAPRKTYIKDGLRKMMTDSGYMHTPSRLMKETFGKLKGGRYGLLQDN